MVKLTRPVLSQEASGSLGKDVIFSSWKGRAYAKQHHIPANPQSSSQKGIRAAVKFLGEQWQRISNADQQTWSNHPGAATKTLFNAYLAFNTHFWSTELGVSQSFPAARDDAYAVFTFPFLSWVPGPSHVLLTTHLNPIYDNWGVTVYHSRTAAFTRNRRSCVGMYEQDVAGTKTWIHTPLESGLHWYSIGLITKAGIRVIFAGYYPVTVP